MIFIFCHPVQVMQVLLIKILQGGSNKNVPLDKMQLLHNQLRYFFSQKFKRKEGEIFQLSIASKVTAVYCIPYFRNHVKQWTIPKQNNFTYHYEFKNQFSNLSHSHLEVSNPPPAFT